MSQSGQPFEFVYLPVQNGYGILAAKDLIESNSSLASVIRRLTPTSELFDVMEMTEDRMVRRVIAYVQLERGIC